MVLEVCVISRQKVDTPSVRLLSSYFPVHVMPGIGATFSEMRNRCIALVKEKWVMRFDSDEEIGESSILRIKEDVLMDFDIVHAKIINMVGNYKWVGYKEVLHKTKLKYVGITHEFIPNARSGMFDTKLVIVHKKTEMDHAISLARDYFFIPKRDPKWFKLRKMVGEISIPQFYDVIRNPSKELVEFSKSFTDCVHDGQEREFYHAINGEYPPGECVYDLPNYVHAAEEVEKMLPVYDPFVIAYFAKNKSLPKLTGELIVY